MVQKRNTIREQILAALTEGPKSSKEIAAIIKCHVESIKHIRGNLVKNGQIEEVGERLGSGGHGKEKVWGLVKPKTKTTNAFDWKNWEPQANYSAREIAYSNSQFHNKTEKRVIVYSRA